MKKIIMSLAIAFMAIMPTMAQNNKVEKKQLTPEERFERKANALSDKMMLDDATKAKFVPMYTEYLKELKDVCPNKEVAKKPCSELTEKEISERIEKRFDAKQKRLDVEKKYYKKFKTVLNARQLQQVFCKNGKGKRACAKFSPRMNCKNNKAFKRGPQNMRQCKGVCPGNQENCAGKECNNKECPNNK